jgi:hypothetical protein
MAIAAKDRKFGSLVPAILGVRLGSIYLYLSHNIKIFYRDLLTKTAGAER